jgi:hypothetical protein
MSTRSSPNLTNREKSAAECPSETRVLWDSDDHFSELLPFHRQLNGTSEIDNMMSLQGHDDPCPISKFFVKPFFFFFFQMSKFIFPLGVILGVSFEWNETFQ